MERDSGRRGLQHVRERQVTMMAMQVIALRRGWTQGWHLGLQWLQQWASVWVGLATGFMLAWVLADEHMQSHGLAEQSVIRLRAQLMGWEDSLAAGSSATANVRVDSEGDEPTDHLPGQQSVTRVWSDLQRTLGAQGLRVESLRPLPELLAAPLPSQSVALRVQGQFDDWARAWIALNAQGPVWSLERVNVVPHPVTGGVLIDGVLRVWLKPGPDGPKSWKLQDGTSPERLALRPPMGPAWFVHAHERMQQHKGEVPTLTAPLDEKTLPSDPLRWPLSRIRLAGILQQGDARQALLVLGQQVVPVRLGQRVAQEDLLVDAVLPGSVRLRSSQGVQHVLDLERGP